MNIKINMLDIRLNDAVGLLLVVGTFAIGVIACDAVPTEMVSTIRRQAVCTTASKHPPQADRPVHRLRYHRDHVRSRTDATVSWRPERGVSICPPVLSTGDSSARHVSGWYTGITRPTECTLNRQYEMQF